MNDTDKIASALGLSPLTPEMVNEPMNSLEPIEIPPLPATVAQDEVIADIEKARQNINNILTKGEDSLTELISLAKQSQSPLAFEAATRLMKVMLDGNKDFIHVTEKKKYAKEDHSSTQAATTNVTNNNLIISTAELLKQLKGS